MTEINLEELMNRVLTCSIKDLKEIFKDDRLSQGQRDYLSMLRRGHETPKLKRIMESCDKDTRTVYAGRTPEREGMGVIDLIDKKIVDSHFFVREVSENIFGNLSQEIKEGKKEGDIRREDDIFLRLRYFMEYDLLFSAHVQYEVKDQGKDLGSKWKNTDCLITKNGIILMEYLHSINLDTAEQDYFIIAPECEEFLPILKSNNLGTLPKSQIRNIELKQPRQNFFVEYIEGNNVGTDIYEERNPEHAVDSQSLFEFGWEGLQKKDMMDAYNEKTYEKAEYLMKYFVKGVLASKKINEENESEYESVRARLNMNYSLFDHYLVPANGGWGGVVTQHIYREILTFEEEYPHVVNRMGYNPEKRRMRLLNKHS